MSAVELSEAFYAKIAGWEAMKQARNFLASEKVLSSNWTPPVLKGVVQEGPTSYRAGLVIKDQLNIENICGCRPSREWGTICAHSVAVGLHHLKQNAAQNSGSRISPPSGGSSSKRSAPLTKRVQRMAAGGEPAEIFLI